MSNKCNFCGGDSDTSGTCSLCWNAVTLGFLIESDKDNPIPSSDVLKEAGLFLRRTYSKGLEGHINFTVCFNKILSHLTANPQEEIKALKETRHNLENQIVNLNNENGKLKNDLKNTEMFYAPIDKKNAELEKKIKELEDAAKWRNQGWGNFSIKTFNDIQTLKQERNDWEKQAGEYRFRADKLAEENAKLNLEVKDLVKEIKVYDELTDDLDKENETLCEENEELCQENEDLDGEAEQYFQQMAQLRVELANLKWPINYYYGLHPVPYVPKSYYMSSFGLL